jgi:hypothetical protein
MRFPTGTAARIAFPPTAIAAAWEEWPTKRARILSRVGILHIDFASKYSRLPEIYLI